MKSPPSVKDYLAQFEPQEEKRTVEKDSLPYHFWISRNALQPPAYVFAP